MFELALLLAQRAYPEKTLKLQEAFRHYKAAPQESTFASIRNLIIVIAVVVLLLVIVQKILKHNSRPIAGKNPRRFFANVLRQLGASPIDRLLLYRAAEHAALPQPAMMLLSPELFEKHAGAWADAIRFNYFKKHIRARFNALAHRVFAAGT